jgi:hypothetical protein
MGLLLLAQASGLSAAEVQNIYDADVPVNGQDIKERHRATRAGLVTVLIKATGNSEIALSPGIPELLDRSQQLLQQYRYHTEKRPDPAGAALIENELLWLRFDDGAIDRAIRKIGLAVWPKARPLTLVWLAVEQNRKRRLYSEQDAQLKQQIEREAARRGIPVTLPLMDLEDRDRLKVTDVWANFQDSILAASKRYAPEGVLVGRLQADTGQWQARWSYLKDGRIWDWQLTGDLDVVIGAGIDGAADILASSVIANTPTGQQDAVRVLVKNINNVDDYARSDAYLRSLDVVLDVQAIQINKDHVLFRLMLRSSSEALERAIRLGDRRILLPAQVPTPLPPPPLSPLPQLPTIASPDLVYSLVP